VIDENNNVINTIHVGNNPTFIDRETEGQGSLYRILPTGELSLTKD
jgi:hypothetical protein